MTRRCLIGLGSNLGDRHALLDEALSIIEQSFQVEPLVSSRFETPAWGMAPGTPSFINQAAVLQLPQALHPTLILEGLLEIERTLGRMRPTGGAGYQSRSIDLDLLAVEGVRMETEVLTLPHPRMHLRRFVLAPLAELTPELQLIEGGPTVAELLRTCADQSAVQRIETAP